MGKFSSILLGGLSGAAAAIFLTTPKGKELTKKAVNFFNDIKENPEDFRDNVVQSASDFSKQATDTFTSVKEKVQSGELTAESVVDAVKDRAQEAVNFSQDKFSEIKEKINKENLTTADLFNQVKEKVNEFSTDEPSEEIIVDLDEEKEAAETENE
ncbi:YtxH domain-containing protein [Streptococcus massiliensis]|uniref:Exported hydrophilic protein n=1 Tax=Streptococcus massiliensis TaxID=313439 RepID=A0A380KWA9_9STRE|nr:YtxH domain-containing protein [Streptococcus massiliensis]SUN76212.1 exported hydrophilic protein [Streptococcus massiliensis]